MPSSWPALRSCAEGFNAQPSTGRAARTFRAGELDGAGAAAILSSAAPSTGRATCASSRGGPKDAARLRSLARRLAAPRVLGLPGNGAASPPVAAAAGGESFWMHQWPCKPARVLPAGGRTKWPASVLPRANSFLDPTSKESYAAFGRLEATREWRRLAPPLSRPAASKAPQLEHPPSIHADNPARL